MTKPRPARRPYRQQLSFGIVDIFLGLGALLSPGHAPFWLGAVFIIIGAVCVSLYVDQTMRWFEKLTARLAVAAHEPPPADTVEAEPRP